MQPELLRAACSDVCCKRLMPRSSGGRGKGPSEKALPGPIPRSCPPASFTRNPIVAATMTASTSDAPARAVQCRVKRASSDRGMEQRVSVPGREVGWPGAASAPPNKGREVSRDGAPGQEGVESGGWREKRGDKRE